MISKIIMQTDGSKSSQETALFAVDLAKQLKASVIVLSVIDHRSIRKALPRGTPIHLIGPIEKHLRETAQRHAGEIKKLCDENGVRSKTMIAIGDSVKEIMQEAKQANTDVIVMGSHESSSFAATLLGSATHKDIPSVTNIPVLLVKKLRTKMFSFPDRPDCELVSRSELHS